MNINHCTFKYSSVAVCITLVAKQIYMSPVSPIFHIASTVIIYSEGHQQEGAYKVCWAHWEKAELRKKGSGSSKMLGFMGPFVKIRCWDVTSLCMQ